MFNKLKSNTLYLYASFLLMILMVILGGDYFGGLLAILFFLIPLTYSLLVIIDIINRSKFVFVSFIKAFILLIIINFTFIAMEIEFSSCCNIFNLFKTITYIYQNSKIIGLFVFSVSLYLVPIVFVLFLNFSLFIRNALFKLNSSKN